MPLAVTHVLVPIILLELIRDRFPKVSKFFSKKHVFLVGFAGLLPDIDVPLYSTVLLLGKSFPIPDLGHRIIFHNLWIPLGFFAFFILFYYILPKYIRNNKKRKKEKFTKFEAFGKVFLILFIGFSIHLILDSVLTGYVIPFYPLNEYMLNWNLVGRIECSIGMPALSTLVWMDALLLLFWLWHEEMEKHILDYF